MIKYFLYKLIEIHMRTLNRQECNCYSTCNGKIMCARCNDIKDLKSLKQEVKDE